MMYDVSEGFGAYKTYLAVRRHFTSDYDYFKYNGKVRASEESFLKRNDKFFFRKISKRYPKEVDLVEFFVSNFIEGDNWIGNLASQESEENYKQYLKRRESQQYIFKEDLRKILDHVAEDEQPNGIIQIEDKQHPVLFKLLLQKKINIETIIIMDRILKFIQYWQRELGDDIIWEEKYKLIKNYQGFFNFDVPANREIMKEVFNG